MYFTPAHKVRGYSRVLITAKPGRRSEAGFALSLACAIGVCALLPPAVTLPLMDSTIKNLVFGESRLLTSVPVIYGEVWFPAHGRYCRVKARTASGAKREQIVRHLAQQVENRVR